MWPSMVCPKDQQPLREDASVLRCAAGHEWPVRNRIPRFVKLNEDYAGSFGLQWNVFPRTQLDSYTGVPISLERARRCIGQDLWRTFGRMDIDTLEVGCGAGRFTEVLLDAGARVTSVDLSNAVEANQRNFPQSDRHRILQASALELPFEPGRFDVVFCLGVVQHTPNPEQTIARLYEQLKPGGSLVIDHYARDWRWYTRSACLVREVLKRLPPEEGLRWTNRLVTTFLPLHKAARNNRLAWSIVARISPVMSYYRQLPLDDGLQREWALLDTHDTLTDWYKHFRTPAQIESALAALGSSGVRVERGGNGVEARCQRPAGHRTDIAVPRAAWGDAARRGPVATRAGTPERDVLHEPPVQRSGDTTAAGPQMNPSGASGARPPVTRARSAR